VKKFNIKTLSLIMIGAGLLTGCAATKEATERFDEQKSNVVKEYEKSQARSSTISEIEDGSKGIANFGKTARNWVDPNPLPRIENKRLPEFFKKNVAMTMPGTVSAVEVLSEMQRSTGIMFEINNDIHDTNTGQGKIITAESSGGSSGSTQDSSPLLISDFVYRGTLEGALDLLAAKASISWKWNGKSIEIFKYETKTYNIAALAGLTETTATVDLKGDTAGSVSSGEENSEASSAANTSSAVGRRSTLTTWDEIKAFLVSQLSPNGTIAILESAGLVTIRDLPSVHKKIEAAIKHLNALLTKQIFLNVDVYSVSVDNKDNAAIDWNLVWTSASRDYRLVHPNNIANAGTFTAGVLTGRYAGTRIITSALSTVGKTSVLNQFRITTLNGQPTPIASNKKIGYLREIKVTPGTGGSPPVYELKPGELSVGINLNITPKFQPNGNILLEYTLNLSDFESIRRFVSPDNTAAIEIPTSNLKSVLQRATLRSGQTLVLSGFKQAGASINKSGIGSPDNILLGGSHKAGADDQYLVITVTPYIANDNYNL